MQKLFLWFPFLLTFVSKLHFMKKAIENCCCRQVFILISTDYLIKLITDCFSALSCCDCRDVQDEVDVLDARPALLDHVALQAVGIAGPASFEVVGRNFNFAAFRGNAFLLAVLKENFCFNLTSFFFSLTFGGFRN